MACAIGQLELGDVFELIVNLAALSAIYFGSMPRPPKLTKKQTHLNPWGKMASATSRG